MALEVQAGPAGTKQESQELKQEGLALPSPAPLLSQQSKSTVPQTQPQRHFIAKCSIIQFLHLCIPSTVMGLVPAPPTPLGPGGKVGARSTALKQLLTHFNSWPADGSWFPFGSC